MAKNSPKNNEHSFSENTIDIFNDLKELFQKIVPPEEIDDVQKGIDDIQFVYDIGLAVLDIFPDIQSPDDVRAILLEDEPDEVADNTATQGNMPPHIFKMLSENISEDTPAFIHKPNGDVVGVTSAEELIELLNNDIKAHKCKKSKKDKKKKKKKKKD